MDENHYALFGLITVTYAACEQGLRFYICDLIDIEIDTALIVTDPYTATKLRDVVLALSQNSKRSADEKSKLKKLVKRLEKFSQLRNAIAHHQWGPGMRTDSIRPRKLKINGGKTNPVGFRKNDPEYTIEELGKHSLALASLKNDIYEFMEQTGAASRMDAKAAS